jgi:uncharacterized membrane protein
MANLIVLTFDNVDEAGSVREALRDVERGGYIGLDDSAIVVRDEGGKVHVKNEVDRGVTIGAIGGGFLGLLIGSVFFPIAGLLVGALGGALIGKAADIGIDQKFVKDVTEAMEPGTSALFLVSRDANPNVALAALKPYEGQVFHTTLSTEAEESLRRVLSERT